MQWREITVTNTAQTDHLLYVMRLEYASLRELHAGGEALQV